MFAFASNNFIRVAILIYYSEVKQKSSRSIKSNQVCFPHTICI